MNFIETNKGEVTVVTVNLNEATIEQAVHFKDFLTALMTRGNKNLVIDCRGILLMDSTFLGALVFTKKQISSLGGDVRIVRYDSLPQMTVFALTPISKIFKIFYKLDEAINSFE